MQDCSIWTCPLSYVHVLQVFLETMRLYPPASMIVKTIMNGGMKLSVGDYFIPGETVLFVSCVTR